MSGLFRYNSNSTTPRRTTQRSFRTTPGQLQDVTMNNSYTYGFRSPSFSACGQGSPGQGRSVKDYEEQMTTLQRENFNLRLRIYFLEEKLNGSASMGQGTESLFKQNVDLKVEIEAQKKELQEKHELLSQAVNAMKYMEDMQKKVKDEAKETENELKTRIDLLELEISEMQKIYGDSSVPHNLISLVEGDNGTMRESCCGAEGRIKELQVKVDQLNRSNEEMREAMNDLEAMHQEKGLKIREFEVKTEELSTQNRQLRKKLESLNESSKINEELKVQLFETREQLAEKMCDQQDLVARLQEKTQAHDDARAAIQKLLKTIKDLQNQSEQVRCENTSSIDDAKAIQDLRKQLEAKDVEIMSLRGSEQTVADLREEVRMAHAETESANKWRKECADLCSILTLRLEELAGFLDSLLKHKDVLGALCADRRHAMRKAIDRSLDLSRSINNSSFNLGLTISEQSLMQMTGFSGILDESFPETLLSNKENMSGNGRESLESFIPGHESLESGKVIEALRSEVLLLRTELEKVYKRKESLSESKKRPQSREGHSESESWSEPDRNVSAARIGLQAIAGKAYNSSTDEEVATPMKKTLTAERISHLEMQVTEKENKMLEMQMSAIERENQMKEEQLKAIEQLKSAQRDLETQKIINEQLKRDIEDLRRTVGAQENLQERLKDNQRELNEHKEALQSVTKERDRVAEDQRVVKLQMETMTKDMECLKEKHAEEIESRVEEIKMQMEAQLQRQEVEHHELYQQKHNEMEVLRRRLEDTQATIDGMSETEIELRALLAEYERKSREAQKSLDEATMKASQWALDRSRAVGERGQLEATVNELRSQCQRLTVEKVELNSRIAQLESAVATLQNQLVKKRASSSDDQRVDNSSPDLGIDSDVARASSSDATAKEKRLSSASTVEMVRCEKEESGLREENVELKKRLVRMKRQLEETVQRLKQSNKHKEQIERDIQIQILKTHNVLKQVSSNMESEAERRNIPLPPRSSD